MHLRLDQGHAPAGLDDLRCAGEPIADARRDEIDLVFGGQYALTFAALNRTLINSSVTKLAIGSTGTNVVSFNDHSHLETVDRALVTYR